jgi:phosphate transport system ATP-binding protein
VKKFLYKNKIITKDLSLFFGEKQVLEKINLNIPEHKVTAIIGPSGCGKSTLLRCINRMNDLIEGLHIEGNILIDGRNIYENGADVVNIRRKIGMVFQRPNPFPKSIYNNIVYGLKVKGLRDKKRNTEIVERSLKNSGLWEEVKERLNNSALVLSGGQQQRLCIARALAVEPEVILMDEPTSALDPASTLKIEELMEKLKERYTIILVTHNMQQAARVSDFTGFLYLGRLLIEFDETSRIFTNPREKLTENYISGRFG